MKEKEKRREDEMKEKEKRRGDERRGRWVGNGKGASMHIHTT